MEKKILVVDDEKSIADAVTYALRREGYIVEVAYNGEQAIKSASSIRPKMIILDIMMPGMSGLDVCRNIDKRDDMGIILLTAKNDIVDKVLGLELGADDYITKPFDIRELLARVRALSRRLEKNSHEDNSDISFKELKIVPSQRKVSLKGSELSLTPKEFDLLVLLLSNTDRVYTREDLLDLVWGIEYEGGTRTVDIHIQRLRKKLGNDYQSVLQTVHSVGYKATL